MLFDTDVLIWVQRGSLAAAEWVDEASERFVSVQTYMELLQGARDRREQKLNQAFLRDMNFMILPLSERIGLRAAV
jgi:predicted nucleic acid-binding protein